MGTTRYARRKLRKATKTRKPRHEPVAGVPINAKTLRAFAMNWARYKHGAFIMAFERNPVSSRIKPDFLFLDKARRLVEVEIKCDLSDFKRDEHKKHRLRMVNNLTKGMPREINYLWYLVPAKLVNYVMEHAPSFAGVMTPNQLVVDEFTGFPTLDILRPAVRLHDNRLSTRLCAVFARDMAGTIASLVRDEVKHIIEHEDLKDKFVAVGGELPKRTRRKKAQPVIQQYSAPDSDDQDDDADTLPARSTAKKTSKKSKTNKTAVEPKKPKKKKRSLDDLVAERKAKKLKTKSSKPKKYSLVVGDGDEDIPSKFKTKKKKKSNKKRKSKP